MPPSPAAALGTVTDVLQTAEVWVLAYGLLLARPIMIFTVSPIFQRADIGNLLRGAIVTAMILPMLVPFAAEFRLHEPNIFEMLLLTVKEALAGAIIGLPLGVPFWSLMVAGDIMDQQRGQSQNRLANPGSGDDVSVSGTLLLMSGIAVFAASGGFQVITDTLYNSWSIWRPLDMLPNPDARSPILILTVMETMFRRGLELALPAVMAMLLSDAAMLIIARIAPQLHLDDVMSAARNLVFTIFLPLYAGYLIYYDEQDQAVLSHVMSFLTPVLHTSIHGTLPGASP